MITSIAVISLCLCLVLLFFCCLCSATVVRALPSSQSESQLESQAHIFYNDWKYLQTIFLLKQVTKLDPKNPTVLTNLGAAEDEASNFTGALYYFKKALVIDAHHIGSLVGIGHVLDNLGNHSAAVTYYKEVLRQPATDNTRLLEKALAFTHLSNYSQALNIANQVLKRNATKTDMYALGMKGVALLYLKNDTAALAIFNRMHPVTSLVLDNKGIAITKFNNGKTDVFSFPRWLNYNDMLLR
jgi:tetratricopeptide (TPR) repeat protein